MPVLALMASISSPELASGSSSLTAIPYFVLKTTEDLAVVAPVVRQGDGREVPLGLGGGDQFLDGPPAPPADADAEAEALPDAAALSEGADEALADGADVAAPPPDEQAAKMIADPASRLAQRVRSRFMVNVPPPESRR